MKNYKDLNGKSGIRAYELLPYGINIEFIDGGTYQYTYRFNGERVIKVMKALAKKGIGLTTFINQEVRENFAEKIK